MKNAIKEYQYESTGLLINGVLYSICTIGFYFSDSFGIYIAAIWLLGAALMFYRYWSLTTQGYIKFYQKSLEYNHANWNGIEKIPFSQIQEIVQGPKSFVIRLKSQREIKIHLGNIKKEMRNAFTDDFTNLQEELNSSL